MTEIGPIEFRLELEDRAVKSTGASVEARTLVTLRMLSNRVNLTSWLNIEDGQRLDALEDIPLIDFGYWLASSWDELIYGLALPPAIAARHLTPAQRWSLSLTLAAQDRLTYPWAQSHALEFAASDYVFPNVVFQRRDDFMEVSWDPRPTPGPGSTVVFDTRRGSTIIDVEKFVALARAVLTWVNDRCSAINDDERLQQIRSVLNDDAKEAGVRAIRRWFPGSGANLLRLDPIEVGSLGRDGASATPAVMFLRSAAGSIAASEAAKLLKQIPSEGISASAGLNALAEGLESTIDPAVPWDSGLQLARIVRSRLKVAPTDWLDIREALKDLHVRVNEHSFSGADIEGACFLTDKGFAVALYNPQGRLSKSTVGRRTTLAHELCHLLFDAPGKALGQLDLRIGRIGNSLLEMRANAFAAELLLPREAVLGVSSNGRLSRSVLTELARRFRVSTVVVEHQAENQELQIVP